jgi:CDP-4-dehydro-6-deoxyglucose reductase, E1
MSIVYPLAVDNWDLLEKTAIQNVVDSGRFTMGRYVKEFEESVMRYFGSRNTIMVNSGSSANLVMLTALKIKFGSKWPSKPEIIVPAISWSTTYTPLYYLGLTPVFVDVNCSDIGMNPELVRNAVTENTVAILAVNILGQPAELLKLQQICIDLDLQLLEDNCESLGATLGGGFTGSFGLASSHSSFFSHHISTMEGGWINTDDDEFADICRSLRAHGWIRETSQSFNKDKITGDAFRDLFHFVLPGLNFRPLEFEGATGVCQISKLENMLKVRRENAVDFVGLFKDNEHIRIQSGQGESSWFAFAMVLSGKLEGKRSDIAKVLLNAGVESRPLIAGNFTKQPVNEYLNGRISGSLDVADDIHDNGMYIGNHPYKLQRELQLTHELIVGYLKGL